MTSLVLYDNRLAAGTLSSSDAGSSWRSALDWRTSTYWRPGAGIHWIQSQAVNGTHLIDAVGLFRHSGGTAAASLWLETSDDGQQWSAVPGSELAPVADNQCILRRFNAVSAPYVRLMVQCGADFYLGVAVAGPILPLPYGMPAGFAPPRHARRSDRAANLTETGQFVGSAVIRRGALTELTQPVVSAHWLRQHGERWLRHLERLPMLWLWSERYPEDVVFAWVPDGQQIPEQAIKERDWHNLRIPLQCLLSD